MKRILSFLTIFQFLIFQGITQILPGDRTPMPGLEAELLKDLNNCRNDNEKAEALLNLSAYYLYMPGEERTELDKAMSYARQARSLSNELKFREGINESMLLIGNIFMEDKQKAFADIIFDSLIANAGEAIVLFRTEKNLTGEARSLRQLSMVYMLKAEYDLAEKELLEVLAIYKKVNYPNLHYTYERLCNLETMRNGWTKALYYALEMIKSMEASGDNYSAASFYYNLGYIYRQIGQFQKALDYYSLAFNCYKKFPSSILYDLTYSTSEAYIKMNRQDEALAVVQNTAKDYPPVSIYEQAAVESGLGVAYRSLKQYDLAEQHFRKLKELKKDDRNHDVYSALLMGQMYMEWGRYDLAKPLLEKSLAANITEGRGLAHLHFMLFKIDSAQGNYVSAMDHLIKNKALDDIIYRETKVRENTELQIKYETEKKNNELKLKEQNILLLSRKSQLQQKDFEQATLRFQFDSVSRQQNLQLLTSGAAQKDKDLQLKQQNIELLKKQDLLKQTSLSRTNLVKNMTVGGLFLSLIILMLLYKQYTIKNRSNKEISSKNLALQHLVEEKEWLLKEVHHRVKNNLHTVMSLLESQSAYLKDDALAAMQNSQHRVYAMSLIHQKLYQLENSTTINMAVYLPELVEYLRDSFGVNRRIRFYLNIENILLDISKAIPVSLIINEAITNSIKYAFPLNGTGEIHIEMKMKSVHEIWLSVKDNGIGIPASWEKFQKNSLGLKLMKGLSDDIQGKFSISGKDGTLVAVEFPGELVETAIPFKRGSVKTVNAFSE